MTRQHKFIFISITILILSFSFFPKNNLDYWQNRSSPKEISTVKPFSALKIDNRSFLFAYIHYNTIRKKNENLTVQLVNASDLLVDREIFIDNYEGIQNIKLYKFNNKIFISFLDKYSRLKTFEYRGNKNKFVPVANLFKFNNIHRYNIINNSNSLYFIYSTKLNKTLYKVYEVNLNKEATFINDLLSNHAPIITDRRNSLIFTTNSGNSPIYRKQDDKRFIYLSSNTVNIQTKFTTNNTQSVAAVHNSKLSEVDFYKYENNHFKKFLPLPLVYANSHFEFLNFNNDILFLHNLTGGFVMFSKLTNNKLLTASLIEKAFIH